MSNKRKIKKETIFESFNKIFQYLHLHPKCKSSNGSFYYNLPMISPALLIEAEKRQISSNEATHQSDHVHKEDYFDQHFYNEWHKNRAKKFTNSYNIYFQGQLPDWFNSIGNLPFRSIKHGNDAIGTILAKKAINNHWEVKHTPDKTRIFLVTSGQGAVNSLYDSDKNEIVVVDFIGSESGDFSHFTILSEDMPYIIDFTNTLPFPAGIRPLLPCKYYSRAQYGFYAVEGVSMYLTSPKQDTLYFLATFYSGNTKYDMDGNLNCSLTNHHCLQMSFSNNPDMLVIDMDEAPSKRLQIHMRGGKDYVHVKKGSNLEFHINADSDQNYFEFSKNTSAEIVIENLASYDRVTHKNGDLSFNKTFPTELSYMNASIPMLYIKNFIQNKENISIVDKASHRS